jgi:tetratricopeptide (TPR) repeat protein
MGVLFLRKMMVGMLVPESTSQRAFQKVFATVAASLTIVLSCIVVYSNTFAVPFLFDDLPRIRDEIAIRTVWPPIVAMQNSNRPFAHYTFAINYAVHGYDVWGYHAVNLVIHCLAALCLFGLVQRSMRRSNERMQQVALVGGFTVALLWAVHPLQTQAVTYIVQRLESLMGLSYLATLYFFVRSQDSKFVPFWLGCSVFACFIGMGCKEVMATAPLAVLWFDRVFIASSWREVFSKRKFYYLLLLSSWGVLAWSMLHYQVDYRGGGLLHVPGLTPWTYLLSQSGVLVHYLSLAVWPSGQCVYPSWPIAQSISDVWPSLLLCLGIFAATVYCMFRYPKLGFLGGIFFLILAPTSSVIPIKDLAFEHRMYLPLASVVTLVLITLLMSIQRFSCLRGSWKFVTTYTAMCATIALLLGTATYQRNSVFQSELSLWQDTIAKAPNNLTVMTGLATLFAKEGNNEQAKIHFERALQIAPDDPKTNANYAGFLIAQNQLELAGECLEKAFQSDPNNLDAITNMAHLQNRLGNSQEAIKYYEVAILGTPQDEELQSSLVAMHLGAGDVRKAIAISKSNLEQRPVSAKAHLDYATALLAAGRNSDAIAYCEKAIALDNQLAAAHATLAMLEPNLEQAVARMEEAIELQPGSPEFNLAMGNLLLASEPAKAAGYFETALQSDPDNIEVLLKIGSAWEACGLPEKGVPFLERVTVLLPDWTEAKQMLESLRRRIAKPD